MFVMKIDWMHVIMSSEMNIWKDYACEFNS